MTRWLFAVALLTACGQQAAAPPAVSVQADSADQVVTVLEYEISDKGARLSFVKGDSAWYYQSSQTWVIKGMTVIFPDSTGRTISTIVAKRGSFRVNGNGLDAHDSVVATTPDGRVLKTEHLIWDKGSNMISSDTAFVLTSPTTPPLIRGDNFTANTSFQDVHVSRPSGRLTNQKPAAPAARKNGAAPVKPPAKGRSGR